MFRQVQNKRQGVLVLHSDVFPPPVIHAGAEASMLLYKKKTGRPRRGVRGVDGSIYHLVLEVLLEGC